jgi:cytochrome oxidase assembly protein ShyY1
MDLERLDQQFDDLLPVWIQQSDDVVDPLPVRVPAPATDDPGPHLPYAFQWYSFAVITAVGYGLLVRRALGGPK